ncbi:unnamed protein product, partial [Prorocentrum cordatum]
MSAVAAIEDVNDVLGVELPSGDYNSIGGFVCMHIDRIPEEGEAVLVETTSKNVRFEVSEVDDRRVVQLEAIVEEDDGSDGARRSSEEKDEEEWDKVIGVRMDTEAVQAGIGEDKGKSMDKSAGTDVSGD